MFWKKKSLETAEYLRLRQLIEELRIELNSLRLDFDLIVTKLKVKYKITTRDRKDEMKEEDKNLYSKMFLDEHGYSIKD